MDHPVNNAQRPCTLLHCIYIEREGRWNPQSIEHRDLSCCYTAYIKREGREMDPPVNNAQRPCTLLHCIYI